MNKRNADLQARQTVRLLLLLALCLALSACTGGKRPGGLGINDGQLAPCPDSPNCVSSRAADGDQQIAPLALQAPTELAWEKVKTTIAALPRTQIISQTSDYLHAEFRSAVFGFVDDLELHLLPAERIIEVRSASRRGAYDFGVNRKRLEELREKLRADETIR